MTTIMLILFALIALSSCTLVYASSTSGTAEILSSILLSTPPGVIAGDRFGCSVAYLADISNSNDQSDLAIGACGDSIDGPNRGAIWITSLTPAGDIATSTAIRGADLAALTAIGTWSGSLDDGCEFGTSIAAIGDIDGDGIVDIAVGAPYQSNGGTQRGIVLLLFLNADRSIRKAVELTSSYIPTDGHLFGYSIAAMNDLDGNDIPDIAIGVPQTSSGTGEVWIYFMSNTGVVLNAVAITNTDIGNTLLVGDAFGTSLIYHGTVGTPAVGTHAALAVGAPGTSTSAGVVWMITLTDAAIVEQSQIMTTTSTPASGDMFGSAITRIGDIDGDGNMDIASSSYINNAISLLLVATTTSVTDVATPFVTTDVTPSPSPGDQFGYSMATVDIFYATETAMTRLYIGAPAANNVYMVILDKLTSPSLSIQSLTSSVATTSGYGVDVSHTFLVRHVPPSLSGAYDVIISTLFDADLSLDITMTRAGGVTPPDINLPTYVPCAVPSCVSYYPSNPARISELSITVTWQPTHAVTRGTTIPVAASSMMAKFDTSSDTYSVADSITSTVTATYNYSTNLVPVISCPVVPSVYEATAATLAIVLTDADFGTLTNDGVINDIQ